MWYVIQTRTGFEHELVLQLKELLEPEVLKDSLVPLYEDVRRIDGNSRIIQRRLLPGYILIDTDRPEDILPALHRINEFTKLLGTEETGADGTEKIMHFLPVEKQDVEFLASILTRGILRVSYIELAAGNRIKRIIGPLAKYGNRITRLVMRKRYAVVEAAIFGKSRRIKFGLWTKEDPKLLWVEEARQKQTAGDEQAYLLGDIDIGIHPGDRVRDISGLYHSDEIFTVESVNPNRRTFVTKGRMFGEEIRMELYADQVEVVKKL